MTYAPIAHVKATPGANGGTTSAIDTSGANLIVIAVSAFAGTPATVTDSKSNTYTALTDRVASSNHLRLFYCLNPAVGTGHTFTFSQTSTFPGIAVAAFSGAIASSVFDVENGAAATSPGSITPSANNELVITAEVDSTGGTPTAPSGYTLTDAAPFAAGVNLSIGLAYVIQTIASATNPTWNVGAATAIASFKAAAGASVHPWWQYAQSMMGALGGSNNV